MFAALAVMVVTAALAWACTPQAIIYLGPSSTGPAGSTINVTGKGFTPGPVEVRMGPGRPLATATGPEFSIPVKIPAAEPGVHYVTAVAYKPDGTEAGQATRALRVKAPAVKDQKPAPRQQPAPPREGTEDPATPDERAPAEQPTADVKRAAPTESPVPAAADPTSAVADPVIARTPAADTAAKRPKSPARPATPQELPSPRTASPPLRELWGAPGPAGIGMDAAPKGTDAGLGLAVGVVLIALGIAGLGGVGFVLMRGNPRQPAPEETTPEALPIPLPETRVLTIEDELQELIEARAGTVDPGPAESEQASPRDTADSPS